MGAIAVVVAAPAVVGVDTVAVVATGAINRIFDFPRPLRLA
jgi:hypothetical protein